ncbi:MAG: hypothetical protein A3I32_02545 [Candidatus Yanofskybacteria bacterium RIFCSPLOWO2_02_FULL_45_10]|uniref:Glycosyl transferase family 1 domain-containing protein n=3 Tax=Patescibacteria group TaxID=1783273 RepID=A0A1F8G414_9BACT|nr:MAG: Glycosyl transferase [Candidatus Daviesbacteria bacterium GW2011_GWB1_41_5]OGN19538.1 MAG: hypothetical protein A3F25_00340 [Candidatus Yanofskybacteria bacterium RIFCSPHIGHO2_12_FULL_45_19b]OGN32254.1 MAG: hypothetical protein A3I32_02545 [Candidatus Yanofskybacteria bacterium RIFCSPLOWO2_02_FULL_45_10]
MKDKGVIVTGHPYAYPYYFKVFTFVDKAKFIFVLPKIWRARLVIKLEKIAGFKIYGLNALSYGRQSFFGGQFKGWLPGILWLLPYLRLRYQPRVLYSCSEPNLLTTLFNGLVAKCFGLRYAIFTWQNIPAENRLHGIKLRLSLFLVRLNLWLADGVICGNKKAELIVKQLNKTIKTAIFPLSGVDVERFKPGLVSDWKQRLNLFDHKTILFYGALDKRKGLNILLDAFKIVQDQSSKLVVVGRGPEAEKLKQQTSLLGLGGRVIFIDWMDNAKLPELLNTADIFVYPSVPVGGWEEQFGYAMAEASACALPVISTQTGSIAEVVLNEKTGILVEPNNSTALALALDKLLADRALREGWGHCGRDYVVENYSHKKIAEQLTNFLFNL